MKFLMMKRVSIILLLLFSTILFAQNQSYQFDIEGRVDALLKQMTLEEKIGQMTQISLGKLCKGYPMVNEPLELDPDALRDAIVNHHIGSVLNVATSAHSLEKWHEIITTIQDVATQESRLGIPIIYGIDAIHGAGYVKGATLFPQNIGMAATWNVELMKKNGEITAYEVRAAGIPWNFNPVLGVGRHPLWSRLWETFGEDPYLVSQMGAAYVKGLEGENNDISSPVKVASCIKHYLGYSFPLTGKDRTPAWIPKRMLLEYFVPPFREAIKAGAHTVMANSSEINGIPVHSSYFYLTELLRSQLGFRGFVVSDWGDIKNLQKREHVAATQKEAVKMAVMAGIDMSMVPTDYSFYDLLLELVQEGSVPESRINEAVARILKVKFELGLFDDPFPNPSLKNGFGSAKFRELNLQAARESLTLLKNENYILPLDRKIKVLVTGPSAAKLSYLNGGWTITWQGDREELYPTEEFTVLKAIQDKIGKSKVIYEPGVTVDREIDIPAAVKAARGVDAVIVCAGEKTYCETSGNITDLTLSEPQLKLIEALSQLKKPIILVLLEGRPRVINKIVDYTSAILMAYLPGMQGGRAIADVIFGDFNPCGKLPITYPRFVNDFTLYDHKYSENRNVVISYNPQFPFGFGLSYTTFEYDNLTVNKTKFRKDEDEPIEVCIFVKNTGNVAGKEVVQLYVSDLYASVTPSVKRLKRFTKIFLKPDEGKTVRFRLNRDDLSFISRDNNPIVEPGEFKISVGGKEVKIVLY